MIAVILVIHLLIAISLIGTILIQKSEGGALGGLGGGCMSGFMTGRSTANLLTRSTAILVALFFLTSLVLAILAGRGHVARSVVDEPATGSPAPISAPLTSGTPASPTPGSPATSGAPPVAPAPHLPPAEPSAPLAK